MCIQSTRNFEEILFYHEASGSLKRQVCVSYVTSGVQGGINIGDVDSKAIRARVPTESSVSEEQLSKLVQHVTSEHRQTLLKRFIRSLFQLYSDLHFVYLEINPLVVVGQDVVPLDMAAKVRRSFGCAAVR